MDDETLERMIKAADPARTPVDAPLTLRQIQLRDSIVAGTYVAHRPATRKDRFRWWKTALPVAVLAACLVAVVVLSVGSIRPQSALALTPPALHFVPTGQTSQQLLQMLERHASGAPAGPARPERGSRTVGWYAQITQDETAGTTAVIAPQVTTIAWASDQSGSIRTVAGKPYWADESGSAIPHAAAPAEGALISEMTFGPGEYEPSVRDEPGTSSKALADFLESAGLTSDGDAADMLDAIGNAFSSWTLTTEQQLTLIKMLLARPDAEILGAATDRAGRAVIGIAADSHRFPGTQKVLLVSGDTGRIVGLETVATSPSEAVPAGAVISYSLWDTPSEP
ncbi:hypothetical protein [Microbacterium luticocti]|uniref:hypothetical protein n=1 Tax=Microbacterium luticocti TaxID=451764 RepID=UPI0012EB08C8|nr:hypothetical protein [Microbacterium luticocti]